MKKVFSLVVLVFSLLGLIGLVAPPARSAATSGIVASATGNGELTAFCGQTRTFSFAAQKDASGNTIGEAQLVNHCNGIISHSLINCLSVSGNVATLSGTITSSNAGGLVGLDVWFRVADNGEGSGTPPDQMTLALTSDPGTGPTCSEDVSLALRPILSGNIQVR